MIRWSGAGMRQIAGIMLLLGAGFSEASSPGSQPALDLARGFEFSPPSDLWQDIAVFTKEPHPLGSVRQKFLARWLLSSLQKSGLQASFQEFFGETPVWEGAPGDYRIKGDPGRLRQPGINVVARILRAKARCTVILASHYDTKRIKGMKYLGANDSASSSVTLLHLARYLKKKEGIWPAGSCQLHFVWFDGEEALLPGWHDGLKHPGFLSQDNTYGSRHFASRLLSCGDKHHCLPEEMGKPLAAVILMDMIGHPGLLLTRDLNSDPLLVEAMLTAGRLLSGRDLSGTGQRVEDDHIPFRKMGIPALNIINFENLSHWHKAGDITKHLAAESMLLAGRIAAYLALTREAFPENSKSPSEK